MSMKVKKVLNRIIDVLIVLVMLFSLTIVIASFTSRSTGVPSLFGNTFLSVQTDSMEPTINVGDLIIGRIQASDAEYEVGDVVTFKSISGTTQYFNTHRIVKKETVNNVIYYTTRGDNAPDEDARQITSGDVISLWSKAGEEGITLRGMGRVMDFLQTQLGFFLCILLPVILFFIFYLVQFILNLMAYSAEKALEKATTQTSEEVARQPEEMSEEEKRRVIEEYLRSQAEQQQPEQRPEDNEKKD